MASYYRDIVIVVPLTPATTVSTFLLRYNDWFASCTNNGLKVFTIDSTSTSRLTIRIFADSTYFLSGTVINGTFVSMRNAVDQKASQLLTLFP